MREPVEWGKGRGAVFMLFLVIAIHVTGSIVYGLRLPWGGDEWYTWSDSSIMGLPYFAIMHLLKPVLGPVSVENFMLYRQIGALFIILVIAYLYRVYIRTGHRDMRSHAVLSVAFLVGSSYVFFQEQYFRYYASYLAAAFALHAYLHQQVTTAQYQRHRLFILLILSPFVHMFLTWQLAFHICWNELLLGSRRRRMTIGFIFVLGVLLIAFNWKGILQFILAQLTTHVQLTEVTLRGFSIGLLIKPFHAIFQFFHGYTLAPTENLLVTASIVILFGVILYKLTRIYTLHRAVFRFILLSGILPLLLMYWLLEPFTLPGTTQFESKHALFVLPFLLYIIAWRSRVAVGWRVVLPALVMLPVLYGTATDMVEPRPDWHAIASRTRSCLDSSGTVVVDGRSDLTLKFYLDDPVREKRIQRLADVSDVEGDGAPVLLVLSDWKSYQLLTREQNWNSGYATHARVSDLSRFLAELQKKKLVCSWVHGVYPTYAYEYSAIGGADEHTASLRPPGIMYKDIVLPIEVGGGRYAGFMAMGAGDSLTLTGQSSLLHMIESEAPAGDSIGYIVTRMERLPVRIGEPASSAFAHAFTRGLLNSTLLQTWSKRPLQSASLAYAGAYWPAEGMIHRSVLPAGARALVVTDANTVIHAFQSMPRHGH